MLLFSVLVSQNIFLKLEFDFLSFLLFKPTQLTTPQNNAHTSLYPHIHPFIQPSIHHNVYNLVILNAIVVFIVGLWCKCAIVCCCYCCRYSYYHCCMSIPSWCEGRKKKQPHTLSLSLVFSLPYKRIKTCHDFVLFWV